MVKLANLPPPENPDILRAYNSAFNDAIATHLGKDHSGEDVSMMSDGEFATYIADSERQPLNPMLVVRESLGYPEGTPTIDILQGLRSAYHDLVAEYEAHNVDGQAALFNMLDIIAHTEAYIAGYSRELGRLTTIPMLNDPSLNAPARWLDKIWVPQEDEHDRLMQLVLLGTGIENMEEFYTDHSRHMQIGVHLPVQQIIPTTAYLAVQEAVTDPSYGNGAALSGPVLSKPLKRIRPDEARHAREYAGVLLTLMVAAADLTVIALRDEYSSFAMPGNEGVRNFADKALVAGIAGVLDQVTILTKQRRLINHLGIEEAEVKSDEAKRAQEELVDPDGRYGQKAFERRAKQLERVRERAIKKAQAGGHLLPAILGVTVDSDVRTGELSFPLSA